MYKIYYDSGLFNSLTKSDHAMARQTFCKAEIRKSVITTIDDRTIGSNVKT